MDDNQKLILKSWIEAVLEFALLHIEEKERVRFVRDQVNLLEHDFKVRIRLDESWNVEIDYLRPTRNIS